MLPLLILIESRLPSTPRIVWTRLLQGHAIPLYLRLSVHMSVCHPSICLSVLMSVCPCIHLSVNLSIYLSVCFSSDCQSVCHAHPSISLSVCLSVCLTFCLIRPSFGGCLSSLSSIHLSVCLHASVFLPVHRYVCLSVPVNPRNLHFFSCLFYQNPTYWETVEKVFNQCTDVTWLLLPL